MSEDGSDDADNGDRDEPSSDPRPENEKPPDKDDKVGPGNPPKHTRFKPGQTGNPKGRPRRSKNLRTVLKEALFEIVVVRDKNGSRRMTRLDALIQVHLSKALGGSDRSMRIIIDLMRASNLLAEENPQGAAATELSEEDEAVLAEYLKRHGHKDEEPEE